MSELDFSALLLGVLGFSGDEYVSICHRSNGGPFRTAVCAPTAAAALVQTLPEQADIYFGVNPVKGPARRNCGRGKAADVTRLSALIADLDVKSGACPNLEVAQAIIDDLSAILGTRPSAVTHSGGGLHPYWPIRDGQRGGNVDPAAVLKRWGRLVQAVAEKHGAKADSVFDLPRVLRVPDTVNHKGDPVPVRCYADVGKPLTVEQIRAALDEYGITEQRPRVRFGGNGQGHRPRGVLLAGLPDQPGRQRADGSAQQDAVRRDPGRRQAGRPGRRHGRGAGGRRRRVRSVLRRRLGVGPQDHRVGPAHGGGSGLRDRRQPVDQGQDQAARTG